MLFVVTLESRYNGRTNVIVVKAASAADALQIVNKDWYHFDDYERIEIVEANASHGIQWE